MSKTILAVLALAVTLSGCATATEQATPTPTPSATATPTPTPTPVPWTLAEACRQWKQDRAPVARVAERIDQATDQWNSGASWKVARKVLPAYAKASQAWATAIQSPSEPWPAGIAEHTDAILTGVLLNVAWAKDALNATDEAEFAYLFNRNQATKQEDSRYKQARESIVLACSAEGVTW